MPKIKAIAAKSVRFYSVKLGLRRHGGPSAYSTFNACNPVKTLKKAFGRGFDRSYGEFTPSLDQIDCQYNSNI
jgi:hypothetical protein